jgi:putative pyruvate formate lyase activating enzyme
MMSCEASYIETFKKGLLREKVEKASEMLRSCALCPRECRVDRLSGQLGICKTGKKAYLNCYKAHFGEEPSLIGDTGSGAFFFTHCSLLCIFCTNYELSHEGQGREISDPEMADMMLSLEHAGCPNINLITPTHVIPQILSALEIAVGNGLSIPLVYNSSGYEKVEALQLLDGVVDIYMPDFKFWDPDVSEKLCQARDYPETARRAICEMHRQVGDLVVDKTSGMARSGLLLRHLLMPCGMAGTRDIMRFVAREISPNTYVNIMPQFKPHGRSCEIKELLQPISEEDYAEALKAAREEGIERIEKRPGCVFMGF